MCFDVAALGRDSTSPSQYKYRQAAPYSGEPSVAAATAAKCSNGLSAVQARAWRSSLAEAWTGIVRRMMPNGLTDHVFGIPGNRTENVNGPHALNASGFPLNLLYNQAF